ncbi:MAG: hypothetical protein R3C56_08255 [Pirellulaceae bacterium]
MNTLVNNKRVLLISYAFPPTGGAGVQRVTKFIKFLPGYGWSPTVLTACNPSVPVQDRDLLADVSTDVAIVRSRTWEPGYGVKKRLADAPHKRFSVRLLLRSLAMSVLQPDPQILWNATAYRAACRQLSQVAHDAILVTAPPFSSFLLGRRLKKKFGLPLVLISATNGRSSAAIWKITAQAVWLDSTAAHASCSAARGRCHHRDDSS